MISGIGDGDVYLLCTRVSSFVKVLNNLPPQILHSGVPYIVKFDARRVDKIDSFAGEIVVRG